MRNEHPIIEDETNRASIQFRLGKFSFEFPAENWKAPANK